MNTNGKSLGYRNIPGGSSALFQAIRIAVAPKSAKDAIILMMGNVASPLASAIGLGR